MMQRFKACMVACLVSMVASAACADTYYWSFHSFDIDNAVVAQGLLTTGNPNGAGFDIISITGTYNDVAITGLLSPGSCCDSPTNNNVLYLSPGLLFVDLSGLAFSVANLEINIYSTLGKYFFGLRQIGSISVTDSGEGVFA